MVELRSIDKRLGTFALSDVNLQLSRGEYFVLLGPSGAGKTILLEIVAGLIYPDAGSILWNGTDITDSSPETRGFAVVYQDYALFPHMTVAENITYGLRAHGTPKNDAARRTLSLAENLNIAGLLDRDTNTLSRGEQQRVALARALVIAPRMLLLDEPLAALDTTMRQRLREELRQLHRETATTFLHVTHDPEEALYLGERVGVMLNGRIHQVGAPEELFRKPSDPQVARFLGMRNIMAATCIGRGICRVAGTDIHVVSAHESISHIWIKPEEVILSRRPFDSSARNQLRCRVEEWEDSGVLLSVRVVSGDLALTVLVTHESFKDIGIEVGRELYCTFKSSAVHCF